jgi:hypothetical protein
MDRCSTQTTFIQRRSFLRNPRSWINHMPLTRLLAFTLAAHAHMRTWFPCSCAVRGCLSARGHATLSVLPMQSTSIQRRAFLRAPRSWINHVPLLGPVACCNCLRACSCPCTWFPCSCVVRGHPSAFLMRPRNTNVTYCARGDSKTMAKRFIRISMRAKHVYAF